MNRFIFLSISEVHSDTLHFHAIDIAIIAIYFLLVFLVGIYFSRKGSSEDYFLAGRNMGWFAVGASLFATNISSEHIIGLAGEGFKSGMAVGNFEWTACIALLFLGWVFAPFFLRTGVATMPEYIGKRFGAQSKWIITAVSLIAYVFTKVSVTLFAGAMLLESTLGWDIYTSSLTFVLITGIYTMAGGLRAVMYTQVIQLFVLIGGAVVITYFGLQKIGGFSTLENALGKGHSDLSYGFFDMVRPASDKDFPWTGVLFGMPILGIWYWCTDQFIVQRTLASRNIQISTTGSIFAGYLKLLPVFIFVLPGIIAHYLNHYQDDLDIVNNPHLSAHKNVSYKDAYSFLLMQKDLIPIGFKGFVIAGLLAALMSSLASSFNSSSTLFTLDVYKKLYPKASEFHIVNVGRFATFAVIIFSIVWVPFIKEIPMSIFEYLQLVQSYIAPPIVVIFIMGIFWKRANAKSALVVLVSGLVVSIVKVLLTVLTEINEDGTSILNVDTTSWLYRATHMNFLHFTIIMFVMCLVLMFVVSYMTSSDDIAIADNMVWKRRYDDSNSVTGSNRLHLINKIATVILLLILVGLWWRFSKS